MERVKVFDKNKITNLGKRKNNKTKFNILNNILVNDNKKIKKQ